MVRPEHELPKGSVAELHVRRLLAQLEPEGWYALHGRVRPGRAAADLDHVVVGPGGLLVLDSKGWTGRLHYTGGRLLRDGVDATSELQKLQRQVADVSGVLEGTGYQQLRVAGGLVFVGQDVLAHSDGSLHLLSDVALLPWLRARGSTLSAGLVRDLHALLLQRLEASPRTPDSVRTVRPVRLITRAPQSEALFDLAALDLAELTRACARPMEEWMVYLHSSQLDVVRMSASGPVRIRGGAGCGKTVVGLHRLAHLLRQEPGPALLTSYVRTLPKVLRGLLMRLQPVPTPLEAAGMHAVASHVLADAGVRMPVEQGQADSLFNRAWCRTGRSRLVAGTVDYWREEVRDVIKGRGLVDFEEYRSLTRTGRSTPLSQEQREHVWALYDDYQALLRGAGIADFRDVMSYALRASQDGHGPRYRYVLVDEAQDLDLVSVRLAASLVTDERNGLTLIADGQQAIYPGGYTLKEAGLQVTGRSRVLSTNYRNTRQILETAQALIRDDAFDDLEALSEPGQVSVHAVREGARVLVATGDDDSCLDAALSARLSEDQANGLAPADAAVLCRTRGEARRLRRVLTRDGHRVMDLADYDGGPVSAVKVGTVKRSKGLEFARVFLPRIDTYRCDAGDAEDERVARERRELYVAITRARDGVWMSQLSSRITADSEATLAQPHEPVAGRAAPPVERHEPVAQTGFAVRRT